MTDRTASAQDAEAMTKVLADPAIVIGRCVACGGAVRYDLPPDVTRWVYAENSVRAADLPLTCGCRDGVRCAEMPNGMPECLNPDCDGHPWTEMKFRWLKVTFSPRISCSPGQCQNAKSSICTCSCNGRNHGLANLDPGIRWAALGDINRSPQRDR